MSEETVEDAAVVADRLALAMLAVQMNAGLSGAGVAALAGRSQPWWSKLTNGQMRQPKVADLSKILSALEVDAVETQRILGLAKELNELRPHSGGHPKRTLENVEAAALLGVLIRRYVKASPLGQTEIAREVGKPPPWLSKLMGGSFQRPGVEMVALIAKVLRMPPGDVERALELAGRLERL